MEKPAEAGYAVVVLELPDDPLRLALLVLMGTSLVVSSMLMGWRFAPRVGVDSGLGALAGIVAGVAGVVAWLT